MYRAVWCAFEPGAECGISRSAHGTRRRPRPGGYPPRAIVQRRLACFDPERIGDCLSELVHIGRITKRTWQKGIGRIVPIGRPQLGVIRRLLQHALEIPHVHAVPSRKVVSLVLALAPGGSLVRVGRGPFLNGFHAGAGDRPLAAGAEMAMHIRPVDPTPTKVGAVAGRGIALHHCRDATAQRHQFGIGERGNGLSPGSGCACATLAGRSSRGTPPSNTAKK